MNYQQVIEQTEKHIVRHAIAQIIGQYDADQYYSYVTSQGDHDERVAIGLNSRPDRILNIKDGRTRGCKYLKRQRAAFDIQYEKNNPRPPSRLRGLAGIVGRL